MACPDLCSLPVNFPESSSRGLISPTWTPKSSPGFRILLPTTSLLSWQNICPGTNNSRSSVLSCDNMKGQVRQKSKKIYLSCRVALPALSRRVPVTQMRSGSGWGAYLSLRHACCVNYMCCNHCFTNFDLI
jgi:hypothetical protein